MPGLRNYPTPWQRKMLWTTLTAIALAALATLVVQGILLAADWIGFLQPLLIPFAIAWVLSYLLEPVVVWMTRRRISRLWAVIILYAGFLLFAGITLAWAIPRLSHQARSFVHRFPEYSKRVQLVVQKGLDFWEDKLAPANGPLHAPGDGVTPITDPKVHGGVQIQAPPALEPDSRQVIRQWIQEQLPLVEKQIPGLVGRLGNMVWRSVAGSLGLFGFLLNFVIVPVYLFLLLVDGPTISQKWSAYLPVRASRFKTELVSVLREINGYLIAFFRGQVVVSVIDGLLTGIALTCVNLNFGFTIGLLLAVIGIIPYIGIVICWIPAVIIAFAQSGGDWHYPMWITVIFIVVQQLDGIFIAPKIVGESVGLHPLTVIVSVIGWTLLLGGLLGAILAVPLTATLKVLLRRYVWGKEPENESVLEPAAPPESPPAAT